MAPEDAAAQAGEARIRNNLFYECGEAAIKFPTRDNDAQGNAYVNGGGGSQGAGIQRPKLPEPRRMAGILRLLIARGRKAGSTSLLTPRHSRSGSPARSSRPATAACIWTSRST